MGIIKDRFKEQADIVAAEIKDLIKEHGEKVIGEVTLSQVYQGMRGITALVSETSLLDAQDGIRFRGYSIPELREKLPKAEGGTEPLPEGLFYLMLVGSLPSDEDAHHISSVWQRRSHVPNHVFATIEALPVSTHPMTQFVVAIMSLQTESQFAKRYAKGMSKKDYGNVSLIAAFFYATVIKFLVSMIRFLMNKALKINITKYTRRKM